MYKELEEVIDSWQIFLNEMETKMQCVIKKILSETVKNNEIFAMFFEYEYDYMDLSFYAFDKNKNVLIQKYDLLVDELNCKTLFPMELLDKQEKTRHKYGEKEDDFDDIYAEYDEEKQDIFKIWFKSCWDKSIKEYKNIHSTYFSIHDTFFKLDLMTNKTITDDEIWK